MSTIVTRSGKGSPLTHTEVDDNFTNLNTDKYQEGSAIGAVTPAAGTFTTLTATGQTSLGGAAGSETVRVKTTTNTGQYTEFDRDNAVNRQYVRAVSANLGLGVTGGGATTFYSNSTVAQFNVSHTASAVNYVQVTGAATGAGPIISVQGSDANAEMRYRTKGVYNHSFQNGNGNANFIIDQTAGNSVVNRLQVAGSVAGSAPSMSSVGSDTNIDLTLTPKGTGKVTTAASITAASFDSASTFGFKNRIINGRMEISQRTATTSVNTSGVGYAYQLDRFYCGGLTGVTTPFTIQQVADAPTGFVNSAKVTVNTTDALGTAATEYGFQHNIEAYNTTDFNLGSASATAVTLSFWVKSSLTGTFGIGIRNAPTFNRRYVATYTINSANTWEQKTVTLTMDTTGTWNTYGTSASINITWSLGCGTNYRATAGSWGAGAEVQTSGSVNLVSNAAATWQITGVQLEKGSTATSFDTRPYTKELQLCQRYYEKSFSTSTVPAQAAGLAGAITSEQFATGHNYLRFPVVVYAVEKRGLPTITFYNPNTASTTPSGLKAGREDGNTSYNNSVGERSNFRSTRDFFPLLDGTNQGGNSQFDVWCTQWTADAEI